MTRKSVAAFTPLAATAEAARLVQNNDHLGKVGVLSLAPAPGLGVSDPERRELLMAGE
jgi:crotonyl-CoA reductase